MQKRLAGVFASAMFVFAACQGAASPSTSTSTASQTAPSASTSGGSAGASASGGTAGAPDLFGTKYKDKRQAAPTGGKIIYADWQEATEFNFYYQAQVTEANLSAATEGASSR